MSLNARRGALVAIVAAAAVLTMTACSSTSPSTGASPASTSAATHYPVTLQNCGRTITIKSEPKRVVSLWQSTTEDLLALGLKDRIVGVQQNYAPYASSVAKAAKGLKGIGSSMGWPSKEVLLSQQPDFVTAQEIDGYAFDTSQGYASVAQIEQTGAVVYGANICDDAQAHSTKTWNVDSTAKALRDYGEIFNVSAKADKVIAKLDAEKQKVVEAVKGKKTVKTAYFNGGTGPLNVLAGGIYDSLISTAGGKDVFASKDVFVSKEAFAASDADVILVGTFPGQSFATEKAFLEKNFPNVPAVKNGRISEVPVEQSDSSIAVMVGLTKIANALHPGLDLPVPKS